MIGRTSFLLAATLFCAATLVAQTTPLNVKTGEWESTMITETSGQLPIPQAALDKMTPEQRVKMEAAMKSRSGGDARPVVRKQCIKKEDLNKPFAGRDENKACKQTILTSSATRQEIHMECEMGGGKQVGTLKVDALDSSPVKGSMQMTASNGGRTMNVNSTFSGKWLGPACKDSDK